MRVYACVCVCMRVYACGMVLSCGVQASSYAGAPTVLFSGYATTDSNGGFANARVYFDDTIDWQDCEGVSLQLKGDGLKSYPPPSPRATRTHRILSFVLSCSLCSYIHEC